MFDWLATDMTGSYGLLSLTKSRVSHQIIFITACGQNVRLQHERKGVDLDATQKQQLHIQ